MGYMDAYEHTIGGDRAVALRNAQLLFRHRYSNGMPAGPEERARYRIADYSLMLMAAISRLEEPLPSLFDDAAKLFAQSIQNHTEV